MLLALALAAPPPPAPRPAGRMTTFRSLAIRMRIMRHAPAPPPLIEKRGPKCVPSADIAGVAVSSPDTVDFALRGGARVRAKLDTACPALDFYGGFYMGPSGDGLICADRDVIRTRAGGECGIDHFRRLEPPKPRKP